LSESGALRVTCVPEEYERVNGVVPELAPLLSAGETGEIRMPLEGAAEFTVSVYATAGFTVTCAVPVEAL
jgi:hypothetical protein